MNATGKKRVAVLVAAASILVFVLCLKYVRSHPLIFNESLFGHSHCIAIAEGYLESYAATNNGVYPYHPDGYGDAILLIENVWLGSFNGPGYDISAWQEAQRSGGDVVEITCGRVYVQGLSKANNHEIAILFDKIASPGDHRHFFSRLRGPFIREVLTIGGGRKEIPEYEWKEYAKSQIELLVDAGIDRQTAEGFYILQ